MTLMTTNQDPSTFTPLSHLLLDNLDLEGLEQVLHLVIFLTSVSSLSSTSGRKPWAGRRRFERRVSGVAASEFFTIIMFDVDGAEEGDDDLVMVIMMIMIMS